MSDDPIADVATAWWPTPAMLADLRAGFHRSMSFTRRPMNDTALAAATAALELVDDQDLGDLTPEQAAANTDAISALRRLRDLAAGGGFFADEHPGLTIPDTAWKADDSNDRTDRSRLFTGVRINRRNMHVLAIEVRDSGSFQAAAHSDDAAEFEELHTAHVADGHYETHTIGGSEYAIFIDGNC